MILDRLVFIRHVGLLVMNEFLRTKSNYLAYDKEKNPVFLASSEWILRLTQQDFPKISFHFSSEFKKDTVIV